MRMREFIIRLGILLPMVVWSVFLFLMVFGVAFSLMGAESSFYCNTYCNVGIVLTIIAVSAVVIVQARACIRK